MIENTVTSTWEGTLKEGHGQMRVTGAALPYTFSSRFEGGTETNPEEFVGAAHSGCYSMFLSALLSGQDYTPTKIETTATVYLDKDDVGPNIPKIELACEAEVPGLDEATFLELAEKARQNCPISRLYKGIDIALKATLLSPTAA